MFSAIAHGKKVGFPADRVLGMSGQLDVARYKSFITEALNVSTKDIQALILGGHGKNMVPMPRYTTIGGIPIRNLLSEEKAQEAIHRTSLVVKKSSITLDALAGLQQVLRFVRWWRL